MEDYSSIVILVFFACQMRFVAHCSVNHNKMEKIYVHVNFYFLKYVYRR